ncbi:hypothetical protein [Niabella sp.]|uniref:hypothetical protein n=1 Tax=Niabella sp. TaxID=1962976 RepID=UPI002627D4D9|nr:hypothetical protein [Niabella sp.]
MKRNPEKTEMYMCVVRRQNGFLLIPVLHNYSLVAGINEVTGNRIEARWHWEQ